MYNHYTELFLKGNDPCRIEVVVRTNLNQSLAVTVLSTIVKNGDELEKVKPILVKQPFSFNSELKNGLPRTIFLIGALIGALTGPY